MINDINKKNAKHWRLNYHIEPPVGLLNDPNGLAYFNGEYFIFYQWNPTGCIHANKHWALVKTKDFISYTKPEKVLAPNKWYNKNGCYSGSAIVANEKLEILYTGNVKDKDNNRSSYQCRVTIDKDCKIEEKGPVVDKIPEGYTADFRDPKLFEKNGVYYFIIGVKTKDNKGRVLLYKSSNFQNWDFEGEIKTSYEEFGYMWECPNLFELGGKDVLIFSPQGLEKEEYRYQNIYQSGYISGKLDYDTLKFEHNEFRELDYGTDFYAPQIFQDNKGRTIMYGWMGLPEEENLQQTSKFGWVYSLTMPRELTLKDQIIYQKPIDEMKNFRQGKIEQVNNLVTESLKIENIKENSYEFILDFERCKAEKVEIRFAASDNDYSVFSLDFKNNLGILDNSNRANSPNSVRKFIIQDESNFKINMFVDKSAVEIYFQDGREVLSSRIYPNEDSTNLNILSYNGKINITNLIVYSMGGINYGR